MCANPAGGTAVHGVGTADDRAAAAGAGPEGYAVLQRFQPFPVPPDARLGLAQVPDPPADVVITCELGEFAVRPGLGGEALGTEPTRSYA